MVLHLTHIIAHPAVNPGPLYRAGEGMRCHLCGSASWVVGRITAECGRCAHPHLLASPGAPAIPRPALSADDPAHDHSTRKAA